MSAALAISVEVLGEPMTNRIDLSEDEHDAIDAMLNGHHVDELCAASLLTKRCAYYEGSRRVWRPTVRGLLEHYARRR